MVLRDFPYCCTMKILAGFGQSAVAEGGCVEISEEIIQAFIDKEISNNQHLAALVVTTNDEQTIVNKVLVSRGFKKTEWMEKPQHFDTKVRLWWLPLHEKPAPKKLPLKPIKTVKKAVI